MAHADLTAHSFDPPCDLGCGRSATAIAQGCADARPVAMCDECLERGLEVVATFIQVWQKVNKRIFICGDCYRPVLRLDTHIDVKPLP